MKTHREWAGRSLELGTGKSLVFSEEGVCLRRGVTLADELGKCNDRDREVIRGQRVARKIFQVDRLGSGEGKLCPYLECDRAGGRLEIDVNGHTIEHTWAEERPYWTDRWTPIDVPADWLKTGENQVVFRALDDSEWSLLIESSRQPDRSSVSDDGGKTWRSEDLGWNNGCDGEYMVRLWLDQYPRTTALESEVVDLCLDVNRDVALGGSPTIDVSVEADTPPNCEVQVSFRSGEAPVYDPASWSSWESADGPVEGAGRFGQWRVELVSNDPNVTPMVQRVVLDVEVDGEVSSSVRHRSQSPIRRSSYRFAQASTNESRAVRLKERWRLNEVVREATSEWDAYLHLRQWVRDQWEDGWDMGEIDFCPPWDAMLILELTSRKLSLGMCTHYATVMSQCCAALGLNARTQIMRSHCINEVYSTEHQKWVAMDVGGDNDDETKFVYHFERDGVPLSAVECHTAWVNEDYGNVKISPEPPAATKGRYAVEKRLQLFERFMISMRNDEMRSLEPGESEHGKGSYHYDGYLFWEDEKTEPLPWFTHHTGRPDDLYWSVNETYIHLQEDGSHIDVLLESPTPDLNGFERSFDGETWEPCGASWKWDPVTEGVRVTVRSINGAGRHGVESVVEVATDG